MIKENYKKALNLIRGGEIAQAIDIFKIYDDDYFISKLNNQVLTPSERLIIEDKLENVIELGFDSIIEAKEKSKCKLGLLDILNILSNDEDAVFYPNHKNFNYKSTTSHKSIHDNYPKFIPNNNISCSFGGLTWHKEQLNLSILAKINGHIELPNTIITNKGKEYLKIDELPYILDVHQWKNYSIVSNGKLNIESLPFKASEKTLQLLYDNGLVSGDKYINGIFILNLTDIPIISKDDISQPIYINRVIELTIDELVLSAKQKVFNSLLKELSPEPKQWFYNFNDKEIEYLTACGVKSDGTYSPPVTETNNKLKTIVDAVLFKINIKGYSSLANISLHKEFELIKDDFNTMGKPYTPPVALAMSAFDEYLNQHSDNIEWLTNQLKDIKDKLKRIRQEIQKDKMILLVGQTWFKDLKVSTAEQVVTTKTNKLPNKEEIDVIIRIHREEVKK